MEKIVLEVDEDLKGLELPLRALFAEAERRLIDARQGRRVDYELFEQRLVQRLGDVERRVHAATLGALVGVRMKRPGSRWKHTTGEHVIQLRALSLSDRWDQAMDLTLRPQPIFARAA